MKNRRGQIITRMATVAVLSALGTVLMMFVKIPYVPAPWCEIEFSDMVILIGYALYGFYGALSVALIKTLFSFLFQGVGFMGIGQIAALLASLTYAFGLFLTSHVFKWFKKGFAFRLLSYILITVLVSLVLTGANFLFITPTYMEGRWATCFDSQAVASVVQNYASFGATYAVIIIAIYLPFNAIKGGLICLAYELLFNRLIFVLMAKSPTAQKYFMGSIKKEKKEETEKSGESYLDKISQDEQKGK